VKQDVARAYCMRPEDVGKAFTAEGWSERLVVAIASNHWQLRSSGSCVAEALENLREQDKTARACGARRLQHHPFRRRMLLSGPDQLGGNRQAVLTEQGVPNAASHDKRVVESENQAGIHRAVHQILDLLARSDNEAEVSCSMLNVVNELGAA